MRIGLILSVALMCSLADGAAIRIEGEDYAKAGGPSKLRVVQRDTASGGKVISYWEEQGVWLEWEFEAPAAGSYALSFRYACQWPDTCRRVEIDGRLADRGCEQARFETTGSWSQHAMHTLSDARGVPIVLSLSAGKHRVRMTNVNSRGLAVDFILLHDPAERFGDVGLSAEAIRSLEPLTLTEPAGRAVLDDGEMRMGRVRATFEKGVLRSVWVADTLFVGARSSGTLDAKPTMCRTANLLARLQRVGTAWKLYVTDGRAFYVAAASPTTTRHRIELWPRAYAKGSQFREAVIWRNGAGGSCLPTSGASCKPSLEWRVGQARISATAPVAPDVQEDHSALAFAQPIRLSVIKIMPRSWAEPGLEVRADTGKERDTLLSSARDYPGLAAFYGYARFRVDLAWTRGLRSCEVVDLAAQARRSLWPRSR